MTFARRANCRRDAFTWGLLAALAIGCNAKTQAPPETAGNGGTPAAAEEDSRLLSAVKQLQPGHLGIDADLALAVSVLNDWHRQSAASDTAAIGLTEQSVAALPPNWLTEEQREQLLKPVYTRSDALYVRNSILAGTMARYATEKHTSELDRVVALFDFAMRTLMLQNAALPQLPFPLYELLLVGQGTPDDRAWLFASLLKQQRIDAVVLQSPDDADVKLVGVILEGEVYLFDTKLGLPIPRGDDPPSVQITRPATLKEMRAHPDWWQALTLRADQPYPWTSEQLAAANVLMIANSESWSGRMKDLETVLPSKSACVLYDPLVPTPTLPSLAERIAAGDAGWTPDKLKFWNHPLNLRERTQAFGKNVQQLGLMLERFRAPLEVVRTKKERQELTQEEHMGRANPFRDEAVFEENVKGLKIEPSDAHNRTRIEQLMGKFTDSTAHYLKIRLLALENPPDELKGNPQFFQLWQRLYQVAASDASYWSAASKIEQGDDAGAVTALSDFLRKYARTDWSSAARTLIALTSARAGKLEDARNAVSALPPNDPHRPGLEVLLKRWDAMNEAKPETTDEPQAETPAAEKTES